MTITKISIKCILRIRNENEWLLQNWPVYNVGKVCNIQIVTFHSPLLFWAIQIENFERFDYLLKNGLAVHEILLGTL